MKPLPGAEPRGIRPVPNKKEHVTIMVQKPLKDKLCISLDPDVVQKIKELAEEDDRSFSGFNNKVLRDYIRNTEKRDSE